MNDAIKRSIASGQPKMRVICADILGTETTPEISGFDAQKISSVEKIGVGEYAINLKYPFNNGQAVNPRALIQSLTPGVLVTPVSSGHNVVQVECQDLAGDPAECDFTIWIYGCDGRLTY